MAYFEEGSKAMVALEAMVDAVGLPNVLSALAYIERQKAVNAVAQGDCGAEWYWQRAHAFDRMAAEGFMRDAN